MSRLTRRRFLEQSLTAVGGAVVWGGALHAAGSAALAAGPASESEALPPLPYAAGALRGLSGALIAEHHGRHFAGHVRSRQAVAEALGAFDPTARDFDPAAYAALKRQEAFHASAVALHTVYFDVLGGTGRPGRQAVVAALQRDFGSLARWRQELTATAQAARSGWAITAWDTNRRRLTNLLLEADQPGGAWGAAPVVALDAWEHAYYHDYGPDPAPYFAAFFANLHWGRLGARFEALGGR